MSLVSQTLRAKDVRSYGLMKKTAEHGNVATFSADIGNRLTYSEVSTLP